MSRRDRQIEEAILLARDTSARISQLEAQQRHDTQALSSAVLDGQADAVAMQSGMQALARIMAETAWDAVTTFRALVDARLCIEGLEVGRHPEHPEHRLLALLVRQKHWPEDTRQALRDGLSPADHAAGSRVPFINAARAVIEAEFMLAANQGRAEFAAQLQAQARRAGVLEPEAASPRPMNGTPVDLFDGLVLATEDGLVDREDEDDGTHGKACGSCGAWVGDAHSAGCPRAARTEAAAEGASDA